MHWATSYIGLPWRRGATGPDAYDCWSFVAHVQKTHFGRDLPSIDLDESNAFAVSHAISNHPERENWYMVLDRKSTRLNSSHHSISYAVFCLKKKKVTV